MMRRVAWLLLLLLASPLRAATYVVDPTGSDAASGAADAPWRSIGRGVRDLLPGDELLVAAGVYREAVHLSRSGAPGQPIAIRDLGGARLTSPQPDASLSAFDIAEGAGDLTIEGFTLNGFDETIMLRPGAHDIVVRGASAEGNAVGVWVAGARDVLIDGCTLHHNRIGVRILDDSQRVTVRDTISSDNDDGAGCDGDADGFSVEETASDIVFSGCVAADNGEDGFDVQADAASLQACVSRDNGCSGIKLGQSGRVENTLVTGNNTGIATGSILGLPVTAVIVNSTVADNRGTQLLLRARPADMAAPNAVRLRNVIASGDGKIVEAEAPLDLVEDHDLFFRSDTSSAAIVRHLPDGSDRRYTGQDINAGVWTLESALGSGTLAIDPGFATPDYCVAADSAATDRGALDDAPAVDRAGAPRPQGVAVDIGPDELPAGPTNHRPWADLGPDRAIDVTGRLRVTGYGSVDPDGDALSYAWDFGDGSSATGYSASHQFGAVGQYLVRLTVSDGQLTQTRSAVIDVRPPATPTAIPSFTATPPNTPTVTASASTTAVASASPTRAAAQAPPATATLASPTVGPPTATATFPAATATSSPIPTATATVQAATATATSGAAMSPTAAVHDSEIRLATRQVRLRLRSGRIDQANATVVVRNADVTPTRERPGHAMQLITDLGACPPSVLAAAADFDKQRAGTQDLLIVEGGRQQRAQVVLRADPSILSAPLHCTLHVQVVGPGIDPTPQNNSVDIVVDVRH